MTQPDDAFTVAVGVARGDSRPDLDPTRELGSVRAHPESAWIDGIAVRTPVENFARLPRPMALILTFGMGPRILP